jgi:autotransporter-associated beta strand protein
MNFRFIIGASALAFVGVGGLQAQAIWTGGGGANMDWSDSSNWSSTPSSSFSQSVQFSNPSGFTSILDSNFDLASLTVASGAGALILTNVSTETLSISGAFTDSSTSTVSVNIPLIYATMSVQMNGTSSLTLNGTSNTYGGLTNITSGTLVDGNAGAYSPNSGIVVAAGANLDVNHNETVSYIDNYMGNAGSVVIASGATLIMNGGYSTQFPGVISGAGSLEKDLTGTLTLTGANTYSGTTVINGATGTAIQLGNGGTTGSIASSGVSGTGTLSFDRSNPYTYAGNLSGALQVVQSGSGTTTLSSANTNSGATTIINGTLKAGSTSAFGGATGLSAVTINGSATLNLSTFNNTIGSLSSSSTSSTVSIGSGATLTIASPSANTTFAGVITGNGGISLQGTGSTLTLEGANSYMGTTTINNGELEDWGATSLAPASSVQIASSGSLGINDDETIADLENIGGTGGPVALASGTTLTIGTGNAALAPFIGTISGTGGITINATGSNSQGFGGASTYTGGTTVVNGELFVGSSTVGPPGAIVSGPVGKGTITFDSGTELSPSANVTLANDIVLNGGGYIENDDGGSYALTLIGQITGTNGIAWCTNGTLAITGNNTFSGGIDSRPSGPAGTILLGSNTAAGSGLIYLENGSTLGVYGTNTSIAISNDVSVNNAANFGTGSADNDSLTINGQVSGSGTITYSGGTAGALTLTGNNSGLSSGTFTIDGGTVYAANNHALGSSSVSVTLNGGTTSAGLNIENGVTISNPLSFTGSGNSLAGSGTIASAVITNSSVVISPSAPTGGPGELTFSNNLTLATGVAIHFDLYDATGAAGTGYSLINETNLTSGALSLTASANSITFNLVSTNSTGGAANAINFNPAIFQMWTFATSANTITGFSASQFHLVNGFTNNTNGGTFGFAEVGNSLVLNFTPVPEPSTWALMGTGFLALATFEVRRRQRAKA